MSSIESAFAERQRLRWLRPDAQRWLRPDSGRYRKPETFAPDGKSWREPAFDSALAALRREHAALRRALAEVKRAILARKAGFDPDQPRVPAGNSDGGQWIASGTGVAEISDDEGSIISDETLDDDWIPDADYAANSRDTADGHHYAVRSIYGKYTLPPETNKVFEDAKTGRLYYEGNNAWDKAHRIYRDAVRENFQRFLSSNSIEPERMTPEQARAFLKEIETSKDTRIRDFNRMIRMREMIYRYRLRFPFRGNE